MAAAAALAAANLHGQGTVVFGNFAWSAVTNSETGERVVAGTTFNVALYYLPANGNDPNETPPSTADFDQSGIALNPSIGFIAPGFFWGGIRTAPTPSPPGGGPGWFQVRVWETVFGATYEQARDNPVPQNGRLALLGTSNVTRVWTGYPIAPEPNPGSPGRLVDLQGFSLYPVPEPSALLLFLLGGWGVGWLRRRAKGLACQGRVLA